MVLVLVYLGAPVNMDVSASSHLCYRGNVKHTYGLLNLWHRRYEQTSGR